MKSAIETLNPTRVKLTVEVTYEELKPSLDAAYKTIGNQVTVPGFRKGHVPPRIIDQRVGRGAVLEEAVNEALPRFYAQAVEESSVRPLGQPSVEITEVPDAASGGELKFTAEVDVRPEITLPDLTAVEITVDGIEVTDADVDAELDTLRQRFGTLVTLDRPAATGDFVSIDIAAQIDGDEVDSVSGVSYEVGSGSMLPGMDEALIGRSSGDVETFSSALAGGDRAGEIAQITVTVQAVKERQLPELDDDFAEVASEFDTLGELRESLRETAGSSKRFGQGLQARERLLEHLLESIEIAVPEGLITDEVNRHLEGENRLDDDTHRAEVETEARTAFKTQILLDVIAEKEQVGVAQGELIEYIVASAQQYGMDPNTFAKQVDEAGQIPAMVNEVARRKALAAVLGRAVITDASGRVIDLASLIPADESDDELGFASIEETGDDVDDVRAARPALSTAADPTALPSFDLGDFEPLEPGAP